ncbi:hypothetical protein EMIT048CA2_110056 [Pseudomonas chlororaphis]
MPSEAGVVKLRAVQHLSLLTNKSAITQSPRPARLCLDAERDTGGTTLAGKTPTPASGFTEKA